MAERWKYVNVEWYYPNAGAFELQDSAKFAAKMGADIVRLRARIHDTTRVRDQNGKASYPKDPNGAHYTMEMRMKHSSWNTYHMYTVEKRNPNTGQVETRRRIDMEANPQKFTGKTSFVADKGMLRYGSKQVKAPF